MAEDDLAFLNLVLLIGTMASQRLDMIAQSPADERNEFLHKARENLDMLTSLKKRTQGRLSPEETKVVDTMLQNLQARYVKALARAPGAPA
jgi:hypothetical protein